MSLIRIVRECTCGCGKRRARKFTEPPKVELYFHHKQGWTEEPRKNPIAKVLDWILRR